MYILYIICIYIYILCIYIYIMYIYILCLYIYNVYIYIYVYVMNAFKRVNRWLIDGTKKRRFLIWVNWLRATNIAGTWDS